MSSKIKRLNQYKAAASTAPSSSPLSSRESISKLENLFISKFTGYSLLSLSMSILISSSSLHREV